LLLSGIFGIIAGAMPNFVSFVSDPIKLARRSRMLISKCVMIALVGVGAGGNLPVDGTMFLEFIPGNKQYLLTFLSIWWALGQVVASLVAVCLPYCSHQPYADQSVGIRCKLWM
jgi:MFS family permease